MSETSKQRTHTTKYCQGNGLDLASGGDPVVPSAISVDLPLDEFLHYNSGKEAPNIQLRWHADQELPFRDGVLDWVYSSHLLEDFEIGRWPEILKEWSRPIKKGGYLVILVPEYELWHYAVNVLGQPCNCAHRHEPRLGELSEVAKSIGLEVIEERLTNSYEHDYSILFVAKKL